MQTNGANGGHQHKVFEKRPSPGTFPNRLDIELCICGVRWWVDQKGVPTTPWQFIGLGAKPGGNEGAGTELRAPPKSALDGLITCGSCGQPMVLDDTREEQEAHYVCQPGHSNLWAQCKTPRLYARRDRGAAGRHGAADSPDRGEHHMAGDGGKRRATCKQRDQTEREGPRGKPGVPGPGGGQRPGEQILPGQNHRRDTDLHEDSNYLLHTPAAGRQPTRGHAPTGGRPAGGGARLKGTVEQPQQANEDERKAACSPSRATSSRRRDENSDSGLF